MIPDNFFLIYGSETEFLNTIGDILSKEETESIVMDYLKKLDIVDEILLNFTPH